MFQIDKSVNLMLKIQNSIYRDSSNVVLSPFSLEILSFSILTGTSGKCFEELSSVLFGKSVNFEDIIESIRCFKLIINQISALESVDFKMINYIYISEAYQILPNFEDFIFNNLDTKVRQINFDDIINIIDQDIRDASQGKVGNVIKFAPTVSKLLLVNSIGFSGEFKYKPTKVFEDKFVTSLSEEYQIQYTAQRNKFNLHKDPKGDFTYVEVPYKNESINLCLILPKSGLTIRDILAKLNYNVLAQLFRSSTPTEVELHIPVLKLQSNIDMAYVLQCSGICQVFEEENANFSKFVRNPKGLFIESTITNSEINIQNIPKDAQNAPAQGSADGPSLQFNRPFIYFINCDMKKLQKIILFSGVVNTIEA